MKKLTLIIAMAIISVASYAQGNTDRIGLGVGVLYQRGMDATLFWEHESRYHNAWEVFVNAYTKWDKCADCGKVCAKSFFSNYNTGTAGVAYKPCVVRKRNQYGSLRLGASAGCDIDKKFLAGIHLGYEHNYALPHGWQFYWQAKVDVMLPKRMDIVRAGVALGFKLPCQR